MPPPPQRSRINLSDLKSQIYRKVGPDRAQCYFGYLSGFLDQKLSKYQFNNLCLETLGRENIPLHNRFIWAILRNASLAKVPPPVIHDGDTLKPCKATGKESPSTYDVFHPCSVVTRNTAVRSNGLILRPSLQRCRSTKTKDQPSSLGPNGKIYAFDHQLLVPSEEAIIRENGGFSTEEYLQGGLAELPTKKQQSEKLSPHDQVSVHSKGPVEVVVEEVKKTDDVQSSRCSLRAPLGIPFCPASVGGARRTSSLPTCSSSGVFSSNYYTGELYHTEALRKRMEQIAVAEGLEGVTLDCANLLNNGLDAYLKRLIRSCVELVGTRSGHESSKYPAFKQQSHGKIVNGLKPGKHMHIQNSVEPLEGAQELKSHHPASMLDFRVAMELNPQQLGEDWPSLLEKLYLRSLEE